MPPFQNFTTKAKEAIRRAHELAIERGQYHVTKIHLIVAAQLKDEFISVEHLFLAMFDIPGQARELLTRFRIDKNALLPVLEELRNSKITDVNQPKRFRAVSKYTRSLTHLASDNKLDPVIGRDQEITRIIQILSRRTKNNPIL